MTPHSAPTIDQFLEIFPHKLPKIDGLPTYEKLSEIRALLKANAANTPTTRGGGQHGYMGIVIPTIVYTTIPGTVAFVAPANPGAVPVIPGAATQTAIGEIVRQHTESKREYLEYTNIQKALINQLVTAIDPIYLRSQKHRHTGFSNCTLDSLLQYLFNSYGAITQQQLADNNRNITTPWTADTPFELLIDQIETCSDIATDGNQPFTNAQILGTAYTLVFNTGMYFDECKTWNAKPANDKTWETFKDHFLVAQNQLRQQQQTAQQGGFHGGANAAQEAYHQDISDALANLATASQTDRQAMAALTNTVERLTEQLQKKEEYINKLKENKPTHNKQRPPATDQGSYCHTHGYLVHKNHNSTNCRYPGASHNKEATRDNNLGGNQKGK